MALHFLFMYICYVRFACILLCIYVLLLSVKPCCADECLPTVKKEQQGKQPSPGDKECDGCSPFYSCGSCAGFVVAKTMLSMQRPLTDKTMEHCSVYQQPYPEEISFSIWQPPQLVNKIAA